MWSSDESNRFITADSRMISGRVPTTVITRVTASSSHPGPPGAACRHQYATGAAGQGTPRPSRGQVPALPGTLRTDREGGLGTTIPRPRAAANQLLDPLPGRVVAPLASAI